MSSPIQPLSPAQLAEQEADAVRQGYVHRDLVAFDELINVLLDGSPDETISSRMARWATEDAGLKREIGTAVSAGLDKLEPDHGAKAEAADLARAQAVAAIEEKGIQEQ